MPEPDWTNYDAVRDWLEKIYPIANIETGSPFYQYLRDEKAKGNNAKRRELHPSGGRGGELMRWIFDNADGNAFCYGPNSMRMIYYPDSYEQFSSESRSPSPILGNLYTTGQKQQEFSSSHAIDRTSPERFEEPAKSKPQRRKRVRKDENTKSLSALVKKPRREALPTGRKSRKQPDPKQPRQKIERLKTLRLNRYGNRPATDFFHPDNSARAL